MSTTKVATTTRSANCTSRPDSRLHDCSSTAVGGHDSESKARTWRILTPAQRIEKLNGMAMKRAQEMEKVLTPSHPDWPMYELVRRGNPVFKHRWMVLLYAYWALTGAGLLRCPSLAFGMSAFIITYLYIELYGAILHVNLDNPSFLFLPVLWEACLEFQYHHVIPSEITLRSYPQIAADLNLIVALQFIVCTIVFYAHGGLFNPYIHATMACGLVNAYLLEWAHRQAHFPRGKRHAFAQYLQDRGFLVSEALHRRHHQTFDVGFPVLSGLSEPVINFVRAKVCANQWVWLAAFILMTLAGLPCIISVNMRLWEWGGEVVYGGGQESDVYLYVEEILGMARALCLGLSSSCMSFIESNF
ncbi:kua-ubiquitin conjugating enzyme hybrid localization domain-containing protein [Nannochloropsis gaditana CCMP526]|uniref:kua-ubiquitin conjugating enzyme hybrid localization domain-containing protein n=1 Tax=Nannochloropsis gaditana (strain CCMP526) TaxID=1093141 RepID=UPI00029F65EC|nr:kua-ubiquitin conjugating enzyme hybrid localization domain-containing protein [Nannochloropsis gaditana CCMP526]EKU21687.1 kua-ubiquitin conjugating enzyme hybrid localization domain-containing protein [Nannochloropsis gaditana CCMP526]|eukprot:XP_005854670.1 kua-ubiquitin conjugating enzyme hybrid localization domain-containing protein [Nannochloropsis gaditana CCMP526]